MLSILGGVTYVLVVARTGTPTVPHDSRGPIWLYPSCDKSSRAYNSDVGYDSQIVTSGGGVTRQTAEEGVGQVT